MGKVSKNARTNRSQLTEEKNMVKVIKAVKSKKGGSSYSFNERILHKDDVDSFLKEE